jgi:alpha-ketoglutarate-dependent taurine dioxygenase
MMRRASLWRRTLREAGRMGRMLIEYRAEPGEIAVFNNRRMLHGRSGFEGGERHLLEGCY